MFVNGLVHFILVLNLIFLHAELNYFALKISRSFQAERHGGHSVYL